MNHSWNMVELNGDFYHVDVTWGDMQDYDLICYDYLLIDDTTISDTHTIVSDIEYPSCTSMSMNYYVMSDTLIDTKDTSCLDDVLPRVNVSVEPTLTLKFGSKSLYDYYVAYLVGEARLFEYMEGPIDYVLNSEQRTLTIERRF